jgi:hypothetical protein
MTEEFLTYNLVSLNCDRAVVMFVSRGGVSKSFKDKFPSIIVWHCANYRLVLSVYDTTKDVTGTNRFRSMLYASMLDMQMLKIGRVLGTPWVASSFRSFLAVWQDYKPSVLHFEEAKNDKNRDKKREVHL